jgi:hypothetical protein
MKQFLMEHPVISFAAFFFFLLFVEDLVRIFMAGK